MCNSGEFSTFFCKVYLRPSCVCVCVCVCVRECVWRAYQRFRRPVVLPNSKFGKIYVPLQNIFTNIQWRRRGPFPGGRYIIVTPGQLWSHTFSSVRHFVLFFLTLQKATRFPLHFARAEMWPENWYLFNLWPFSALCRFIMFNVIL